VQLAKRRLLHKQEGAHIALAALFALLSTEPGVLALLPVSRGRLPTLMPVGLRTETGPLKFAADIQLKFNKKQQLLPFNKGGG